MKKTALFIFFIGQQQIALSSETNIYENRGIFVLEDTVDNEKISPQGPEFKKHCLHQAHEIQKEKSLSCSSDFDAASASANSNSDNSIGYLLSNGSFGRSMPSSSLKKDRTLTDYVLTPVARKYETQA